MADTTTAVSDVHRALGLTDAEAVEIERLLGRRPNHLELAMYSVMWSEHCSYKSSRLHLKRLPTEAPWVLVGPGENAGVIDVGDGLAIALRIESHNHPSAIEPYQGAATGVGGIIRDIFTMGARPIALMDPLRFGPLDDSRSRWIAEGVISGVSGYGNAVGVPTVGGETVFDETYAGNPLVNVFCLGIMPVERLVLGQATGVGNLAVLLGSATGRDGIGGVSVLASAGFDDAGDDQAKRPSVQVGDPYEEKRLLEACLALLDEDLVVGIQDLGGAGLSCATSETASRGGVGMDVDINAIPCREVGMEPFEIMTSESQERMLAIVEPEGLDRVLAICARWEVDASVIGVVTDGGALRIRDGFEGEVLADIPAKTLHENAPLYDRVMAEPADLAVRRSSDPRDEVTDADLSADVVAMLGDAAWVYGQYDHQLFLNTVVGPGDDATLLRLRNSETRFDTGRAIGLTCDGNHRWCAVDPNLGTQHIVAEAVMNLACVGARPRALVNCLNFGNPEHPEVMWQLSESIDGMAEGCRAFDTPVVGGNVSLYNESNGRDIDPTPVVAVLGDRADLDVVPPGARLVDGDSIVCLGSLPNESSGLAGSRWAWDRGHKNGMLDDLDYPALVSLAGVVRGLVCSGSVSGVHDIAEGGLGLALTEMAVRGDVGCDVLAGSDCVAVFHETPGRVLVSVGQGALEHVRDAADRAGVPLTVLGVAGGSRITIGGLIDISLAAASAAHIGRLPNAMVAGTTNS